MRKLLLSVSLLAICVSGFAQFQGSIDFIKIKGKISVNYKYLVKGENVRIEEYGDDNTLDGIQLVNTSTGNIYALSPDRKMYMEAKNKRPQRTANIQVEKTKTTKTIAGKTCKKWIVTNKEQDRKIVYWVAKGDYSFFIPLLKAMNRAEKSSVYWLMIEGNAGYFPLLAEEYNTDGVLISKLETSDLKAKTLDKKTFEIPSDYKKFER